MQKIKRAQFRFLKSSKHFVNVNANKVLFSDFIQDKKNSYQTHHTTNPP